MSGGKTGRYQYCAGRWGLADDRADHGSEGWQQSNSRLRGGCAAGSKHQKNAGMKT